MVNTDCKFWQPSCDLCGITGDDHCPRKCEDYQVDNYGYEDTEED